MRPPSLRISTVAGPVTGKDAQDFASQIRKTPILNGRLVSVEFTAATSALVRHALKRRYVGAMVVAQSAQHTQSISAVDPTTLEASGYDPTVYLGVAAGSAGGVTFTGTVYLWCF